MNKSKKHVSSSFVKAWTCGDGSEVGSGRPPAEQAEHAADAEPAGTAACLAPSLRAENLFIYNH
jgi:hypothetical protein